MTRLPRPSERFLDAYPGDDTAIASLQILTERVLTEWELRYSGEVFAEAGMCYVIACMAPSGEVVVKIDPNPDYARREVVALRAWSGKGAAELLAYRELDGALALMTERIRPGTPYLMSSDPGARSFATVVSQLHEVDVSGLDLPSSSEQLADMLTFVAPLAASRGMAAEHMAMERLAERLESESTGRPVLVHGDLTPHNLLRSRDGSLRAIDPYGYVGPAEREVAEAAIHMLPPGGSAAKQLRAFVDACVVDHERARGYARLAAWSTGLIRTRFASRRTRTGSERLIEYAVSGDGKVGT